MASFRNGPRAGRGTGRARNTLANNSSKKQNPGGVPAPPVSPGSAAAYGNQMAQLQLNLAAQLAQGRAQRGMLQGQFRMDKADIRSERIGGMADAVGGAVESGILGGSADLERRSGVDSAAAAQMNKAIQAKVQGILGIKMDRINATNEYYTGVYGIQAAKAAERAEAANRAFLEDLVMRMNDESAPPGKGGGGGGGGTVPTRTPASSGAYGVPTDTSVGGNRTGPAVPAVPSQGTNPQQTAWLQWLKQRLQSGALLGGPNATIGAPAIPGRNFGRYGGTAGPSPYR